MRLARNPCTSSWQPFQLLLQVSSQEKYLIQAALRRRFAPGAGHDKKLFEFPLIPEMDESLYKKLTGA